MIVANVVAAEAAADDDGDGLVPRSLRQEPIFAGDSRDSDLLFSGFDGLTQRGNGSDLSSLLRELRVVGTACQGPARNRIRSIELRCNFIRAVIFSLPN